MRVIIAGGGTGGHLYPGIALADELNARDPGNQVMFVGTPMGLESKILPQKNIPLRTIGVAGIKGKSLNRKAEVVSMLPWAVLKALGIIREFVPDLVIGLGAYVSGPVLAAAWLAGVRRVIQEQNLIPGLTNRISGRLAHRVFVSFEESRRYFNPDRVMVTGNPIRKEFIRIAEAPRKGFGLLVFGGSRGAHRINRAMVDALDRLVDMKSQLHVLHQTGSEDLQEVREAYKRTGIIAGVEPFIEDMVTAYMRSRLVVCRAGATTLAEVTACGRASILVPYPFAANNHQEINARHLVEAAAARMILDRDLSGSTLAAEIRSFFDDPSKIHRMERASARMGKPDAAKHIVDECYRMVMGKS